MSKFGVNQHIADWAQASCRRICSSPHEHPTQLISVSSWGQLNGIALE